VLHRLVTVLVVCSAALVCNQRAEASPLLVWNIYGHTTTSDPALFPQLPLATPIAFSVAIDLAAPDLCANAGQGLYLLSQTTMAFGGTTYTGGFTALEVNNPLASCLGVSPGFSETAIRIGGFSPDPGFSLVSLFGTGTPDGSIPLTPAFGSFLITSSGLSAPRITGTIDRVEVIPEPASVFLLGTGAAALAFRRMRRRRPSRSLP